MSVHSNYDLLIQKLDQFIRKYYTDKIIKGSLYTAGAVIALFLVFNTLEYYLYFGTGVRKFLFFCHGDLYCILYTIKSAS